MRLLVCFVFAVGCTKPNPNYCPDQSDNLCHGDSGGMACTSSAQCTGNEKVCKLPEQVCVQCTTAEASACMGTTPICTNDRCSACTKHADCPSSACMPDGSCASEDSVAYVMASAANNPTCSKGAPCGDVQAALAVTPPKSIIKIDGTITAASIPITNRDVTMLGGPNATLNRTVGDILVVDGSSKVRLYDLTLSNAQGNTAITGLATFTGELELQRCTVTNNSTGINILSNGTLILGRSTVSFNTAGGVLLFGTANRFDITNNFIFRNGNENNSNYGGLNIEANATTGSRLEFNTIVDNDTVSGGTRTGGVKCDITGFSAPNNILARNAVGNSATQPTSQKLGVCEFGTSIIQPDMTGLAFVRPDQQDYNYRISTGSTAVDKATTGAMIMVDVDGEARPNGMARDVGADELH